MSRTLRLARSLALAATAALAAGCGGASILDTVEDTAAGILLPIDQEIALGNELAAQLAAELTFHPNLEVQEYVTRLGNQVVANAADRDPAITFTFEVVDDDETVNAFAIPGGHIYVYSGLLLTAENEAEVMAVLSHEVAHVTQRHVAERFVATYGLQQVVGWALGENSGAVAQLAAEVAATGVLLRHGRGAETEADTVGFGYLVRCDYDPHGFVWFFSKLTGASRMPEFLSSHPNPENRIEAIEARIAAGSDWPTRTGATEFEAIRAQL